MPLSKASRHGQVDVSLAQVVRVCHGAADESVHHAIVETGQQLRGQAVSAQQLVILRLACAVDNQVGAVTVSAQENCVLVNMVF